MALSRISATSIADGTVVASEIANYTVSSTKMANTGVVANTYGNASIIPVFTVDSAGRITSASNVAISVPVSQGGTGATSFTAPLNGVSPLIYYNGTSFATDSTVTDIGYDTSNHIFNARIVYASGNITSNGAVIVNGYLSGNVLAMAANSVNCAASTYFSKTISSAATITFDSPPQSGRDYSFVLKVTNGGSNTITWPSAVKWSANTAPSFTSSGVDLAVFSTDDGGTTWRGSALTGFTA